MKTLITVLLLVSQIAYANNTNIYIQMPSTHIQNNELAIIVNDKDPLSKRIARYYQQKRGIPDRNIIHISFKTLRTTISPNEFNELKKQVDTQTPANIQAYALTWAEPYRVGCMSITTAFASGYSKEWCSSERCGKTQASPYFNSSSKKPYYSYQIRPTMAIAAINFKQAKQLIDRGIQAQNIPASGTAYLVNTSDKARSVRSVIFPLVKEIFSDWQNIEIVNSEGIRDKKDVMFYFTGRTHIPDLDTLTFLPGAVADHLTSSGGKLTNTRQMSSLRWLEAGATGSYGTVVEPCNLLQKFPNPLIMMSHYLRGETLVEAYWKSVAWPGQGIFIGDPLARPFAGYRVITHPAGDQWIVQTQALAPGNYQVFRSYSPVGPYQEDKNILHIPRGQSGFDLATSAQHYLRIVPVAVKTMNKQGLPMLMQQSPKQYPP
ncbi:MAG: TIGR03790 family protein [Gammaproteobacteria bacterium]|nr:TIGR03790 family protein [Gammaproteobacteria bacterium]